MKDLIIGVFVYLLLINIYGFIICGIDKQKARNHQYRISEHHLFFVCFIGGSPGILIGMKAFRHKTKHTRFIIGVPIMAVLWIAIITALIYSYYFIL